MAELIGVAEGQWYRLLTAAFLHAGLFHLLMNMFALFTVGPPLEAALGRSRFLTLYVLSALGGSTLSMLVSSPGTLGVGASGAIFGLFGAFYVVVRRGGGQTGPLLLLLGINLVITFSVPIIDWRGARRGSGHRRAGRRWPSRTRRGAVGARPSRSVPASSVGVVLLVAVLGPRCCAAGSSSPASATTSGGPRRGRRRPRTTARLVVRPRSMLQQRRPPVGDHPEPSRPRRHGSAQPVQARTTDSPAPSAARTGRSSRSRSAIAAATVADRSRQQPARRVGPSRDERQHPASTSSATPLLRDGPAVSTPSPRQPGPPPAWLAPAERRTVC